MSLEGFLSVKLSFQIFWLSISAIVINRITRLTLLFHLEAITIKSSLPGKIKKTR